MFGEGSFLFEDNGIDPERIVNDEHRVANEFFCAICQGLLWKAKSCASCQHLFCQNCIRTWLQMNPTSCPLRCSPYEERRPPPHIHSLLGRLSIRCRNSSFGCQEILSYDALEKHETSECQFLSKRCRVCGKDVRINEIDEHQAICISPFVRCFICKENIDRNFLSQHVLQCIQGRLDRFIERVIPSPEAFGVPTNNAFVFPPVQENVDWLVRLQRFLSAMPQIDLIGYDRTVQDRHRNICIRIWTMLRLMWWNSSRSPQILFLLLCFGWGFLLGFVIATSLFIKDQVEQSVYRSFALIILFTGLFSFTLPVFLTSISDTTIILSTILFLTLLTSALPMIPLDYFKIYQNSKLTLVIYSIVLLIFKFVLLIIRFYVLHVSPYITAGCVAWMIMFITFHMRRTSINRRRTI